MKYKAVRRQAEEKSTPVEMGGWIPSAIIGFMIVLLPFVFSSLGWDKFRFPKELFAVFGTVTSAALFLALNGFRGRWKMRSWESLALLTLLFIVLHTLLVSNHGYSWSAVLTISLFAVLYFLLQRLCSTRFLFWVWLGLGFVLGVSAVLTVLQYFGLVSMMVSALSGDVVMGRVNPAGFIGEVNSGGFLFAIVSIILVYFVVVEKARWVRVAASGLILFNLLGVAFARTLTAVAGLSICLFLWLLFHHWWFLRRKKGPIRGLVVLWIALLLGGMGAVVVGSKARVVDRVQLVWSQLQGGEYSFATAGRQPVYALTWEMIKEAPWLGRGLNSFGTDFFYFKAETPVGQATKLIQQAGSYREVHNEYLQIWEELGLCGLGLFLSLFAVLLFSSLRRLWNEPDPDRVYWIGLSVIGLVFVAVSCLAFFPLRLALTGISILLLVAGLRYSERAGQSEADRTILTRPSSWTIRVGVAALVIVLAGSVQAQRWIANNNVGRASFLLERISSGEFNGRQRRTVSDEALARLERAEAWLPEIDEIDNLKGTAFMMLGRYKEAAESYGRAARSVPSAEVLTNLAVSYIALGDFEEADKQLEIALDYDDRFRKALEAREHIRSLEGK